MITIATDVLIYVSAVAVLSIIGRFILTRWFTRTAGRLYAAFAFSMLCVCTLAVLGTTFGQAYPGRDVIRLIGWSGVSIMLWWSSLVLWVDQWRGSREEADNDEQ